MTWFSFWPFVVCHAAPWCPLSKKKSILQKLWLCTFTSRNTVLATAPRLTPNSENLKSWQNPGGFICLVQSPVFTETVVLEQQLKAWVFLVIISRLSVTHFFLNTVVFFLQQPYFLLTPAEVRVYFGAKHYISTVWKVGLCWSLCKIFSM